MALEVIYSRIHAIEAQLKYLTNQEKKQMAILDNLTAAVAEQTTIDASVVKKIDDLVSQIAALVAAAAAGGTAVDPVALQGLVDQIKANDATLAAKLP